MKFLWWTDPHLHQYVEFASGTGIHNSRLVRSCEVIEEMMQEGIRRGIKAAICGGDLFSKRFFHRHELVNKAYDALQKFPENEMDLFVLRGNHDNVLKDGSVTTIHSFSHVSHVISTPQRCFLSEHLHFIPYTDDFEAVEAYLSTLPDSACVVGHFDV